MLAGVLKDQTKSDLVSNDKHEESKIHINSKRTFEDNTGTSQRGR